MKKLTIKQAIEIRDYYKGRTEWRTKTINKLKETNAPKIILDNEERMLKEFKKEYIVWELALDFYMRGYKDAKADKESDYNLLNKDLMPKERLYNAIFDETKFTKGENDDLS